MPGFRGAGSLDGVICPRCGHPNEEGARFCSSCGRPLAADEETVSMAAVDEPAAEAPAAGEGVAARAAAVVVVRGPNVGSSYALGGQPIAAGRHPDSGIFLDDVTVSRRHAVIERRATGHVIRDVGSLNGTYVNHERVESAALHDGDEVQIGRYVLAYRAGGDPDAGP